MNTPEFFKKTHDLLKSRLNEKQIRLVLAAFSEALGHGGITRVAKATRVSRPTLYQGIKELNSADPDPDRIRRKGAGRKKTTDLQASILLELEALLEPNFYQDPFSPLRWTCKSFRELTRELKQKGIKVSYPVVGEILKSLDYRVSAGHHGGRMGNTVTRQTAFLDIYNAVKHQMENMDAVIILIISRLAPRDTANAQLSGDTAWKHADPDSHSLDLALHALNDWKRQDHPDNQPLNRPLICVDGLQNSTQAAGLPGDVMIIPPGIYRWSSIYDRVVYSSEWTRPDRSPDRHSVELLTVKP